MRRTTTGAGLPAAPRVLEVERLLAYQALLRRLPVNDDVIAYAVRLVGATRPGASAAKAAKALRWGAGPRASQALYVGARAWAALRGKPAVGLADVRAVAPAVLRHRVSLDFEAEATGQTADDVVRELLAEVG